MSFFIWWARRDFKVSRKVGSEVHIVNRNGDAIFGRRPLAGVFAEQNNNLCSHSVGIDLINNSFNSKPNS